MSNEKQKNIDDIAYELYWDDHPIKVITVFKDYFIEHKNNIFKDYYSKAICKIRNEKLNKINDKQE